MDSVLTFDYATQDFISSMLPQRFALPPDYMSYIKEKQNAKVYDKLIKTCKYFFYSKGFVVVADIYDPVYNQIKYFGREIRNQINLPEEWQNQRRKLWINEIIYVCSRFFVSTFFPLISLTEKIYRCENIDLVFRYQSLKYEELKVISEAGTFKLVSFSTCRIVDNNGTKVFLEDIIALFPHVKEFFISDKWTRCSPETAKALFMFSRLKRLMLWGISDIFNIEDFIFFVKTHGTNEYYFNFDWSTPATYVTVLKKAIKAVRSNWNSNSEPPIFYFYEKGQV